MWVAYFAPRWIHDRNEFSGKSVERFKSALRVVANQLPQNSSGTGAIHIDLDREAKIRQTLLRRRIMFTLISFSKKSKIAVNLCIYWGLQGLEKS